MDPGREAGGLRLGADRGSGPVLHPLERAGGGRHAGAAAYPPRVEGHAVARWPLRRVHDLPADRPGVAELSRRPGPADLDPEPAGRVAGEAPRRWQPADGPGLARLGDLL